MFPLAVGNARFFVGGCIGFEHFWRLNVFSQNDIPKSIYCTVYSLAPSVMLEVSLNMALPVSGCRSGSVLTLSHTSISRFDVMSSISLWWIVGKAPLRHKRVYSTVKEDPLSQTIGICDGDHPYLSANASVKAPLCRQKLNYSIGRDFNQFEAPFSLASFTTLLLELERVGFNCSSACAATSLFLDCGPGHHLVSEALV